MQEIITIMLCSALTVGASFGLSYLYHDKNLNDALDYFTNNSNDMIPGVFFFMPLLVFIVTVLLSVYAIVGTIIGWIF